MFLLSRYDNEASYLNYSDIHSHNSGTCLNATYYPYFFLQQFLFYY